MKNKNKELIDDLSDLLLPTLKQFVQEQVEHQFLVWTKGVFIKDRWCCNVMRRFAYKHWGIQTPFESPGEGFVTVRPFILGEPVNYCFNCGRKL